MIRLRHAARLDLRLQARYGLYYAAVFVTLFWIAMLYSLPASTMRPATPLVIFGELAVIGYYFVAGMILFEKGERTLSAVVVSPLRFGEYLASKLITLTIMATVSSLILVLVAYGPGFDVALLVSGVTLISLISVLAGFISVLPFDQITRYLIPSQLPLALMSVPPHPFSRHLAKPSFLPLPDPRPPATARRSLRHNLSDHRPTFLRPHLQPALRSRPRARGPKNVRALRRGRGWLRWPARCWRSARTTPETSAGTRCC